MPEQAAYTFHDAGLHSRPLRALNAAGSLLRRAGVERPTLRPEALLEAAFRKSGKRDLGEDTVHEPLAVLCDAFEREGNLTTFGRLAVRGLLVDALSNRLELVDWAARHPEVREEQIERPWIVIGLPRTGTTLLSILLGQDPTVRPLEQWEASRPVPPPELATWREDPRVAECAKRFDQLQALNPPIRAMHPFGATLATECVTLMVFDLRSLSLETQAFVPSYGRWLEDCDMDSAYRMHRLALQVLQSRLPTQTWSLKTPNHLWCLPTLLAHYPDARIVWTHRDPRKVVPSVASLNCALQRAFCHTHDPVAVGRDWNHKLHLAVTRGLAFDAERDDAWCCHVQYEDLIADPITAVGRIYEHFGEAPEPLHTARMQAWMRDRPQEVHGRHRYRAEDFRFGEDELGEPYDAYRNRFGVPEER